MGLEIIEPADYLDDTYTPYPEIYYYDDPTEPYGDPDWYDPNEPTDEFLRDE
jgi:hypothetical protein